MRILILGGTRFFGRELALLLIRSGHEVTVLTRGRAAVPEGASHVSGDRGDPAVLARAARMEPDAVIDNIAYTADHAAAAVAAFAGRTAHYVLTSSTAVYLLAGRPPYFEEDAPPPPSAEEGLDAHRWAYTLGKIAAERVLFSQQRLSFSILRPPVVIGPNDPTLRLYFYVQRLLDGGPLLLLDGGKHCFHLADSQDLASAFRLVLEAPQLTLGKAYNVCQPDVLSLEELILAAAEELGVGARVVPIPASAVPAELDYPEPLGPYPRPMICPPRRACEELGFRPRPVLEAVRRAVRWHAEHPAPESAGYARRPEEIALAERFQCVLESA
jgi:nucleoside-diphosphate-sugar epimerase